MADGQGLSATLATHGSHRWCKSEQCSAWQELWPWSVASLRSSQGDPQLKRVWPLMVTIPFFFTLLEACRSTWSTSFQLLWSQHSLSTT